MSKRKRAATLNEDLPRLRGRVDINVGGTVHSTTYETLRSVPGSMLATLFAEDSQFEEMTRDEEGRPYIDRDPRQFGYILDFLRTGQVVGWDAPTPIDLVRLRATAEYYGLEALAMQCCEFRYPYLALAGIPVRQWHRAGFSAGECIRIGFPPINVVHALCGLSGAVSRPAWALQLCTEDDNSPWETLGELRREGCQISDLGPGIRLDHLMKAGYNMDDVFGLKVKLSGQAVYSCHEPEAFLRHIRTEAEEDANEHAEVGFVVGFNITDAPIDQWCGVGSNPTETVENHSESDIVKTWYSPKELKTCDWPTASRR